MRTTLALLLGALLVLSLPTAAASHDHEPCEDGGDAVALCAEDTLVEEGSCSSEGYRNGTSELRLDAAGSVVRVVGARECHQFDGAWRDNRSIEAQAQAGGAEVNLLWAKEDVYAYSPSSTIDEGQRRVLVEARAQGHELVLDWTQSRGMDGCHESVGVTLDTEHATSSGECALAQPSPPSLPWGNLFDRV